MNKNIEKKAMIVVAHVVTAAWMILIFYMSAQPGDTSGEISGGVSHLFMKIWNVVFFQGWSEAEVLHMAEVWDYPIRKLAHMTEFGILAMLSYWTLGQYAAFRQGRKMNLRINRRYAYAWGFAVIYAATDEIHQLFVPDRDGNFIDVLIDAGGAVLALLFVFAVSCLLRKYRKA